MREWRQEFPEKMRRAIIRIHTNFGHPQNSTLAKTRFQPMVVEVSDNDQIFEAVRFWCTR